MNVEDTPQLYFLKIQGYTIGRGADSSGEL